jgi:hypothetical protein
MTLTRRALAAAAALLGAAATAMVPLGAQDSTRLRVSVVGQAAHVRSARGTTVTPERDVSLRGIDAEFWLARRQLGTAGPASRAGLGFALRAHQSTLGGDDLAYHDVSVLYGLGALVERIGGPRVREAAGDLAAELAVGSHAGYEPSSGLTHGAMHPIGRLGVRAATRLMPSPLWLEIRMSGVLPVGGPDGDDGVSGFDGDGALRWQFARWPVDVAFGYRFQRLRVHRTAQEASALRLELGWRAL